MTFKSLLLLCSVALTPTLSFAQGIKTFEFLPGDNGGALQAAQTVFGSSRNMETTVMDLDNDGAAEIGVRFPDTCDDAGCEYSVIYFQNNGWIEIFNAKQDGLTSLLESTKGVYALASLDNEVKWTWTGQGFFPTPINYVMADQVGSYTSALSESENADPDIQRMSEIERIEVDLNSDGTKEVVIRSKGLDVCSGFNDCPVVFYSNDGTKIASKISNEGLVALNGEGDVILYSPSGFSTYAFSNQTLVRTNRYSEYRVSGVK